MINIRSAVGRHLTSPPWNRKLDIIKDIAFQTANHVFTGVLKTLRKEGLDVTSHHPAISQKDMEKLYSNTDIIGEDTPKALQNKVWLEMGIHFGRRGREGWRELKVSDILFKKDEDDDEYVTLKHNELDKNHQGVGRQEEEKKQVMYAQEEYCPVRSLKKYIAKLDPACPALFQKPKQVALSDGPWYEPKPISKNALGKFLSNISKEAKLSVIYTNHCLKATAATILNAAGTECKKICAVTGHKSETSVWWYINQNSVAMKDRKEMCSILHKHGKSENTDSMLQVQGSMSTSDGHGNHTQASSVAVSSTRVATNMANLFHGAIFSGPTYITINPQV